MKKCMGFILAGVFGCLVLAGCGADISRVNDEDKLNIVCTTFPQYDWVSNIIKGNEENISLTLLMDKGGDLHNFQPSALDIARVSGCDIFIYVGGESDTWVDDVLKEAANQDMIAVNMMKALEGNTTYGYGVLYEDEHDHEDEQEDEYDEHVWLSLGNAMVLNEYICSVLMEADSENASLYRSNCDEYTEALSSLDRRFRQAVALSDKDTLLFADRFPFRYLVEEYGLKYYAAFDGCSAETEASFSTVATLSDTLTRLGLNAVSVIDGSDKRLARVIIENSDDENRSIVVFDSMQSVSKSDIENGATYLLAMESNLEALKEALY